MKITHSKHIISIICALTISIVNMPAEDIPIINMDDKRDMQKKRLNHLVAKIVLVTGIAANAKEGAVLHGKYGPLLIKQLESWPENLYGKTLTVKGVLSSKFYPYRKPGVSPDAAPEGLLFYLDKYEIIIQK